MVINVAYHQDGELIRVDGRVLKGLLQTGVSTNSWPFTLEPSLMFEQSNCPHSCILTVVPRFISSGKEIVVFLCVRSGAFYFISQHFPPVLQ